MKSCSREKSKSQVDCEIQMFLRVAETLGNGSSKTVCIVSIIYDSDDNRWRYGNFKPGLRLTPGRPSHRHQKSFANQIMPNHVILPV